VSQKESQGKVYNEYGKISYLCVWVLFKASSWY
jgi:hypothetical protein